MQSGRMTDLFLAGMIGKNIEKILGNLRRVVEG